VACRGKPVPDAEASGEDGLPQAPPREPGDSRVQTGFEMYLTGSRLVDGGVDRCYVARKCERLRSSVDTAESSTCPRSLVSRGRRCLFPGVVGAQEFAAVRQTERTFSRRDDTIGTKQQPKSKWKAIHPYMRVFSTVAFCVLRRASFAVRR
jgi:hypothetical protein